MTKYEPAGRVIANPSFSAPCSATKSSTTSAPPSVSSLTASTWPPSATTVCCAPSCSASLSASGLRSTTMILVAVSAARLLFVFPDDIVIYVREWSGFMGLRINMNHYTQTISDYVFCFCVFDYMLECEGGIFDECDPSINIKFIIKVGVFKIIYFISYHEEKASVRKPAAFRHKTYFLNIFKSCLVKVDQIH